jgi:hypothetical protein
MQRIILVYGVLAGVILVALFQLTMVAGVHSMLLGYLSMFVALSLVFVGTRKYRDEHKGGVVRFWPALGVGLGIAGIASLLYVLGWEAYLAISGGDFMADYTASILAEKHAGGASAAQLAAFKSEMAGYAEMYKDPLTRMLLTLSEIAPVTLLVPLISALLLRRPGFMPAKT